MSPDDLIALWNFADPGASESSFRELLTGDLSDAERIEVQTQLARAIGVQRHFEEAFTLLEDLRPEVDRLDPADPVARRATVRWFLERGRTLASAIHRDHPGRALRDYATAFDRAVFAGEDALAADAAHMAAIVTEGASAEEWTEKGLAVAEASADLAARNWRGSLLTNRGMTRHEQGDYAGALADFEGALVARREQGDPDRLFIAEWMVAWAQRSLGRHDEAVDRLTRLQAQAHERGRPDPYVFDELAENYRALGLIDQAEAAESHSRAVRGRA